MIEGIDHTKPYGDLAYCLFAWSIANPRILNQLGQMDAVQADEQDIVVVEAEPALTDLRPIHDKQRRTLERLVVVNPEKAISSAKVGHHVALPDLSTSRRRNPASITSVMGLRRRRMEPPCPTCYIPLMSATAQKLVPTHDPEAAERFAFALKLQEIEGNPLDAEDLAMFAMFNREGLTADERIAYITAEARKLAAG
jgi:hypothetical protein